MKKISVKYFSNYKSFTFPCLIYALNLSVFCSKIAQKDKKLLKATITAKSCSKGQVAKTGLSRTLLQARGRGLLKNIWVKSGESGTFLFSRCVPDFCDGRRSFPIDENSNLCHGGRRRWISLITNPINCPPNTEVSIFGTLSISGQIHRENQGQNCGDFPIYLGRSAKSKIPDHLGFS